MGLLEILLLHTFVAGFFGMLALWHTAAWKLSTESIDSPKFGTRWLYRYLIFSFWFALSFISAGPLTTWQLVKLPEVQAFARNHSWFLFVLNIPPAALLYYLHRKFVIWCDPVKLKGRKRLSAKLASRAGR